MRNLLAISIIILVSSSAGREELKQEYLMKGSEITSLTQAELLKNVAQAMQKGGPVYAIEFCNLRALALKDSLSQLNDCDIQRLAIKYRNPLDKPSTESETAQLNDYQEAFAKGDSLGPVVHIFEDRVEYYQPILINNGACLICHGAPGTQIADQTLEVIRAKYPDDKATGFAMNDLRGAWKITFKR